MADDKTSEIGQFLDGSESLAAMVRSEVDLQISTAHRYPRDLKRFHENVMSVIVDDPEILKTIGEIFPMLKFELVVREGRFGPEIIDAVSKEFEVAKNNIFIGAPEEKHSFSVQDLGGVRVIF